MPSPSQLSQTKAISLKMYEKGDGNVGTGRRWAARADEGMPTSCIPKRRYVKRHQGFFGALHPHNDEPRVWERFLAMIGG